MRKAALILFALIGAAPVSAVAATPGPPQLRYSVEAAPAQARVTPRYSAGIAPPAARPVAQPSGPAQAAAGPAHDYRLGPGDKVHVTVYGEADLSGDFEISGNGRIAFPLIGEVQAGGLTAPALGAALTARLAGGYLLNPRVGVEIAAYRPFYIVGQVNKPGRYAYADGMTAMNAIALAGGFTPHAAESYVYVRHEGKAKEMRLPADAATQIVPGDVVRVSESGFWSVMGILSPLTGVAASVRYGLP